MTKPDFEKIFASGGTTLPLTDSQFLQGFAYLGENPPTKEEFNWLFQQLCLKMQWLNQNAGFGRWQADHNYAAGEICFSSVIGDYRFAECTVGGQSGTTEPTWGEVGSTVTDGGVTWIVRRVASGSLLNVQVFTSSGTYTPTAGMKSVVAYVQGGGGGSGGLPATASAQWAISGGAGSGALAIGKYSAATIGSSQTVTVGAGGEAGTSGGGNGGNGGTSSLGAIASATGGYATAPQGAAASTVYAAAGPSLTPVAIGGNIVNIPGIAGTYSLGMGGVGAVGGPGAPSPIYGGQGPGAGGGGAAVYGTSSGTIGNNGKSGIVVIYEYA